MDPVPVDEFQKFDSSIRRILKQVHPDAGLTGESYSIISIIQVKKAMELIGITPKSNESILYISGVCEYIISEIVELAGNCARDDKKVIIKPKHILIAIITDDELDEIFYKMIRKLVSQRDWLK